VIPPASTGSDSSSRMAVMKIAQQNSGSLCMLIPGCRMFRIVVMKFIAPSIELIPARCRLKIARSTAPPEWLWIPDRGGYRVHPDPTPCSTSALASRRISDGGSSQKLMLFSRGNAISGAPIITGTR
jgi:hypothetical protein